MILELGQAAADAVKNPGILSGAGRVLIDGTIIVGLLKIVEALISRWRTRRAKAQAMTLIPPEPKPGESDICKDHLEQIKELRGKIDDHGRELAGFKEFKGNTSDSLKRIEGKVDDLKDIIIGRERT